MSESIAISTGHATFEAFIEEYAQRCDEHYLVLDVGTALSVGDAVEFALYLDDGSPIFYGAGECAEVSDNGDEVDASYRYRVILGALALDEENQNILAHILAARGAEPAEESAEEAPVAAADGAAFEAAPSDDDDDNALPEEPTSFIEDSAFVSDAPSAAALSPEATSLVDSNDFLSSPPSAPAAPRVSEAPLAAAAEVEDDFSTRELDLAALSDIGPASSPPAASASVPPSPSSIPADLAEARAASIPLAAQANDDQDDEEFADPATTIGQIAGAAASIPAPAASNAPVSFAPLASVSSAPSEDAYAADDSAVSFDDGDSEPAAPMRFSGPPLSAPPPSEISAVAPLPARPESGLRRITMTPSWSPVAEPSESMGPSTGLFVYANGVLPIPSGPARPRNAVARVLFARELLDLAPSAPVVDEDNATSEIDIGSL